MPCPTHRHLLLALLASIATACGGKSALNDARPDRENTRIEVEAGSGHDVDAGPEAAEDERPAEDEGTTSEEQPGPPQGTKPTAPEDPGSPPPGGSTPSGGTSPGTAPGTGGAPSVGTTTVNPTSPLPPSQPAVSPENTPPVTPTPPPTPGQPGSGPCEGAATGSMGCPCVTADECQTALSCVSGSCQEQANAPVPVETPPDEPPIPDPPIITPRPTPVPPPDPGTGGAPPTPDVDVPPEIDGVLPEECTPTYQSVDEGGYCALELDCAGDYVSANCEQSADWTYCWCQSDSSWTSVDLPTGGNIEDQCTYMAELCEEVDLGTPEECDVWQEATSQYCYDSQECWQEIEFVDGGYGQTYSSDSVWCQDQGDLWACSCNNESGSAEFEWARSDSESAATCQAARDLCGEFAAAEPYGPITCEQSYQSAGSGYCNAQQQCRQAVDVAGQEVYLQGGVWMECFDSGDGTYLCSCASGSDSAEFDTPAAGTAWDTCSAAMNTCLDSVDVAVGSGSGGNVGRPIPVGF